MSDPPAAPVMSSQATELPNPESLSLDEAVYKCACGVPETSELWICCDNNDCPVKWYHWQCVRVTEELPGHWLCPSCSLALTQDSKSLGSKPDAQISEFPKPRNTAERRYDDTLGQPREKKRTPSKSTQPPKKGIAIKKPQPQKQKPKWTGWVEMPSEEEEEYTNGDAPQEVTVVTEARQTKARLIQSMAKSTRSRMRRGGSNSATGPSGDARMVLEGQEPDPNDSNHSAQNTNKSLTNPHPSPQTPNPSPPTTLSPPPSTPQNLPNLPPPPTNTAPPAITINPQATTPLITTQSPDGTSAVNYWSYRTNTWCTVPVSAMRSTLPRLL